MLLRAQTNAEQSNTTLGAMREVIQKLRRLWAAQDIFVFEPFRKVVLMGGGQRERHLTAAANGGGGSCRLLSQ